MEFLNKGRTCSLLEPLQTQAAVCVLQLLIPAVLSWTLQDGTLSLPEALRYLFCWSLGFPYSEPLLLPRV